MQVDAEKKEIVLVKTHNVSDYPESYFWAAHGVGVVLLIIGLFIVIKHKVP